MTDNEIIKALECCEYGACRDCPIYNDSTCMTRCREDALDLIYRQKAEIERLTKENNNLRESECDHCACVLLDRMDKLKEEIVKLLMRNFCDKEIQKIIDAI